MKNKDRTFFQYNSGDLVYVISPLMSQLHTTSRKVKIKYDGPVVIYKILDPPQLSINDIRWQNTKRNFELKRLKPANIVWYYVLHVHCAKPVHHF